MIRLMSLFQSGITAHQHRLDQVADNVANLNTVAFKRREVSFTDLLYDLMQEKRWPVADQPGAKRPQAGTGVRVGATVSFFEQGPIIESDRPLDLTIEGEGFFRVIRSDGTAAYTRQGSFYLHPSGSMVTARGEALDLPFNLHGYRLTTVTISPEGIVAAQNETGAEETLGAITLYRFTNPDGLLKSRSGQFLATDASGAPQSGAPAAAGFGSLRQFSLEGSNANIALEMVQLITAQRALRAAARGLTAADELQALALQVRA